MSKSTINILNSTVRNPGITSNDFVMIAFFQLSVFNHKNKYTHDINSDEVRRSTGLSDKVINKVFLNLYNQGYLLNEIGKRSPHKPITVCLNERKFNIKIRKEDEFFTEMPILLFNIMKNKLITPPEFRFLYYIQSYINNTNRKFCFCKEETIANELGISKPTVIKLHRSLEKKKLLDVTQHKLEHHDQYDQNDKYDFKKFNNHYVVRHENFERLYKKSSK
ncbi:helix-turn-helix domain-containing protein [Paenibacillus sp. FSL E2-0178]|uniref:helix-turn-helix domain-containing protein n=1 Tax=Paenibacillus sp. FSL E2-0178 TaxID=2921361 RepID=UPI0031597498